MKTPTVYTYAQCDTCRRAVKWLRAQEIAFTEKPIRETPPTLRELDAALRAVDGDLRRLFNTSGRDYRAMKLGDRLSTIGKDEAFALLAANGNLVKRPLLIGGGTALVGFKEDAWKAALL